MQNPPIKICPHCQQPAPLDALTCLGCGSSFETAPVIPIRPPSEAYPTREPMEMPFSPASATAPGLPTESFSSPSYPTPVGLPLNPEIVPPQPVAPPIAGHRFDPPPAVQPGYSDAPGAWQPGQQPPPQQSWQPGQQPAPQQPWQAGQPPSQQTWQPGQPMSQPPQQTWQVPAGQQNSPQGWNGPPRAAQSDRMTIALCAIFLGPFGIHKFLMGKKIPALIMLLATVLTCGIGSMVTGLIGFVEGIIYLGKSDADFQSTYILGGKDWF